MLSPDDLAFLDRMEQQADYDLLLRLDVKRVFELSGYDDTAVYTVLEKLTTDTVRVIPGAILGLVKEARRRR